MADKNNLIFLKLGGSLITDKTKTSTARPEVILRIAEEIKEVRRNHPELQILLGHGSGSFGHQVAKKYGTRLGVKTKADWKGFAEVWLEASKLNRLVVKTFHQVGLPVLSFPASSSTISENGKIKSWQTDAFQSALKNNMIPLVYGDVVFDHQLGGTVLSTEDIFSYLVTQLKPQRILLAGSDAGVYADYPDCKELIPEITHQNINAILPALGGSAATDVTGGMASKVTQMLSLTKLVEDLEIIIFSGKEDGSIKNIFDGVNLGTRLSV